MGQVRQPAAYDTFTAAWLAEARRILKPDGTLWVIGSYHNIFRVGAKLQDLGYWILNDIVWRKANPMPNFRGTRFTNAHETLIWASHSDKSRYTFNYRAMKTLNDELQMRSDWSLPICGGAGTHQARRDQGAPDAKARGAALSRAPCRNQSGRCCARPILRHRHDRRGGQAARPPLHRHRARPRIYRSCRRAHRRCPAARRIGSTHDAEPQIAAQGRVRHFGRNRHAAPGQQGFRRQAPLDRNGRRRWFADQRRLRAGSIHKLGATLQGLPSCNGWTFWHFERDGAIKPIDALRQDYILATEP